MDPEHHVDEAVEYSLPPRSAQQDPLQQLCDICKKIDLSPSSFAPPMNEEQVVFKEGWKHYLSKVKQTEGSYVLGDKADISERKACPICRLVTRCLNEYPTHESRDDQYRIGWMSYGEQEADIDDDRLNKIWGHKNKSWLAIDHGAETTPLQLFSGSLSHGYIVQIRSDDDEERVFLAREIKAQVDLNVVKNWMKFCTDWHGDACEKLVFQDVQAPQDVPELLVIDVCDERIVSLPAGGHYLTLSYVWGQVESLLATKANIEQLKAPQGLTSRKEAIPRTIRDAIQLTKELGERYLWVDQLCIIQDDPETKQTIINSMDIVYGRALLTIIAASGCDANAGLSGLFETSRKYQQAIEVLDNNIKLTIVPEILGMQLASPYEQRGWTYQEYSLSRRCLIFLNDRVLFRCRKALWQEDVHCEYESEPGATTTYETQRWASNQDMPNFGTPRDVALMSAQSYGQVHDTGRWTHEYEAERTYMHCISKISRRRFSYPADILDASAGILRPLAASLDSRVHYGIIWYMINLAILWSPTRSQSHRRVGFPSWTWAGWDVGVESIHSWGFDKGYDHWMLTHGWIHWMYLRPSRPVLFSPDLVLSFFDGLPEHAETFKAVRQRDIFSLIDVGRVPRIPWLPGSCDDEYPLLDSVLWFWTVTFCLHVAGQNLECDQRFYLGKENLNTGADIILELQDSYGKFAGRVLYQGPGNSIQPLTFKLLALSRWDGKQPYSSNLAERLGFDKFHDGKRDWGSETNVELFRYPESIQPIAPPAITYPSMEEREEVRLFNVLLVVCRSNRISERVGIGIALETGIKNAMHGGPVWEETMLG